VSGFVPLQGGWFNPKAARVGKPVQQGPSGEMVRRYIWGHQRLATAEEGHILMSGEDAENPPGPRQGARPAHVSVFRPGQTLADRPITLDQRTGREIFMSPTALVPFNPARVWESVTELTSTPEQLTGNGLFPEAGQDPVTRTFDMLRTRVLQTMATKKWTRLAITSPTHGCGKSFVAANLALSIARLPSCRTVLLDLELRDPQLAYLFGQTDAAPLIEFLMGEQPLESHFRRFGRNLALGLNGEMVPLSSELLQDPEFANAMGALRDLLQPDIVIFDTPPALVGDDVISLAEQVDAVLLVADGTRTSPEDLRACERLFEGRIPLLGVVLNRAQDRAQDRYAYGNRG
jgi:Mrp family chromosome partitioning ATPase